MPLVLKYKTQIDISAEFLWVTDKTGEYSSPDNEGGWGNPNQELNQSALLTLINLKHSTGDIPLMPVGVQVKFSAASVNSQETMFQFNYESDGYHDMYLIRLPVSNDGLITLEGIGLSEGDYFYYTAQDDIYQIVNLFPVLVEDYNVILDDISNQINTRCQEIFLGLLSVQRSELYLKYREDRNEGCNVDNQFDTLRMLTEDLIGADYTFRSGLTTQAEDQTETLLDEYDVTK